jgi:RNA polymerase sigma-70 factor (ECF subfamily)
MTRPQEPTAAGRPQAGRRDDRRLGEVTVLLKRWGEGDEAAVDELLPLVYRELREIAAAYLAQEREGHTLQGTALVHEAYLRLAQAQALDVKDRLHFFAIAARTMRRILVDHARSQLADKRVGAHRRLPLDEARLLAGDSSEQVLEIHEVLDELKARHPRQGKLVELRFFGGLSEEQAAQILEVSRATLTRDWRFARLWLFRRLTSP